MSLFDRVRLAFRGKKTADQPEQLQEATATPKIPEISGNIKNTEQEVTARLTIWKWHLTFRRCVKG